MSFERWSYLWAFVAGGSLSIYFSRVASDPSGTVGGRLIVGALDSWFLRSRWSREPNERLRTMSIVMGVLALLGLVLLFVDPTPRYPK
jgi:hypothetical protein